MGGDSGWSLLRRPLPAGLLLEAGFLILQLPSLSVPARVAVQILLFAVFLAVLRSVAREGVAPRQLRAALVLACLFRLTLLFAAPFYSGDLYRYLWDGRVQVKGGINPYLHEPGAEALAPLRDTTFPRINHPDVPTAYPPVAQVLFVLVSLAGPSAGSMKGAMVICDLLLMLVLLRALRRVGLPEGQVLIYAWNPLVIAEVAGNGHVDILGVLLLIAGIHLIIIERSLVSTFALGLSAGAKFLPILAFPILLRRVRPLHRVIPFLVLAAAYLPYAAAGAPLFRGLREYAERWQHNDSLFSLILAVLERLNPTPVLKEGIARLHGILGYPGWVEILYVYAYPVYLARVLAFLLALFLAFALARKRADPIRGTFLLVGAILLLSPTVHPWYLLWIVPFLAFRPSRAWILLTGLVPLSYLDPGPMVGGISGDPWVRWAEYLPFFILLLADAAASYRRRDPITLFGLRQFPPGLKGSWPEKERAGSSPPSCDVEP